MLVRFEWYFVYSRNIAVKTFLYLFIDEILFLPNIGSDRVLAYFEIIVSINIRVTIAPGYNGH